MNDQQLLRYSRHILLPELGIEAQERLLAAKVLIVGLGGLGSPVALYLAASGVGQLTLCDDDQVDLTNLQRQIIHHTNQIGHAKVDSARERLQAINPDVAIHTIAQRLEGSALRVAVAAHTVVVDASDNFATRHALNAACVASKVPLVSGAATRFDGQLSVFDARRADSPCYHCLFPAHGDNDDAPCVSFGVFAPLVGMIGSAQAAETLKLITGLGEPLVGQLLVCDVQQHRWRHFRLPRDPYCAVCGAPSSHTLQADR
jgi:molybdopterin/thiamine biosynthesis adenylyltransferase